MEMNRRQALTAALLPLVYKLGRRGLQAEPQAQGPTARPLFEQDLPDVMLDNWQVTALEVTYPPGGAGAAHRHPGFVLVYVLEGAVVTKISGEMQTVYQAGEMFYEPVGSTHEVSRNASATEPAKLLALILAEKGVPLTNPA